MAQLSAQEMPWNGFEPTLDPADSAGDEAPVGSGMFLYISNSGTAAATVTVSTPGTAHGAAIAEAQPSVAAGGSHMLPLLAALYRNPSTGRADISYSDATDLSVAVVKLP